jgi:hypothetical protein
MNLRDEHVDAIHMALKDILNYNEPEDDTLRDILEFALWAKEEQQAANEREGRLSDEIEDLQFCLQEARERIEQLEIELRLTRLNCHPG